jgi:hypothetical protein
MRRRRQYTYFTKIDLWMQFYSFELDEPSKKLCTIVTPFGVYQYNRLPMGCKVSPDLAQFYIEQALKGLDVEVYIDDCGIWTNGTFEEHLALVDKVLERLAANGFKCNPLKCEWAVQETDFLGYWMPPTGIRPWRKKVDAILKMDKPQNVSQLRTFLGAVNFYRTMWIRRSHVLAPLNLLLSRLTNAKSMDAWDASCDNAFREMKAILLHDIELAYYDPNLPVDIYTDASDYQMGAAIFQNGSISAYWSKRLTSAQLNYSTMEKGLLAVVYCFKEFHDLFLGAKCTVYTDHRNLTFKTLNAQRVLRWRLFLDQYDVTFKYVPGPDNVLADCFSRVPRMAPPTDGKRIAISGKEVDFAALKTQEAEDDIFWEDAMMADILGHLPDSLAEESHLNVPATAEMQCPVSLSRIAQHQQTDQLLMHHHLQNQAKFPIKTINGEALICYSPTNSPNDWRICIPQALIQDTLRWYHLVLVGTDRLYSTIKRRFYLPNLRNLCNTLVCDACQPFKLPGRGYGHLATREVKLVSWDTVCVDLIGPWQIQVNGQVVKYQALTCIDPVTNLVEMIRIKDKSNVWLSRYPRPNNCIYDNGTEITGWMFRDLGSSRYQAMSYHCQESSVQRHLRTHASNSC